MAGDRISRRRSSALRTDARSSASYTVWAALAVVVLLVGVLTGVLIVGGLTPDRDGTALARSNPTGAQTASEATTAVARVEVPRLVGLPVVEAQTLLEAAGLETTTTGGGEPDDFAGMVVARQSPAAGSLVDETSIVSIVIKVADGPKKRAVSSTPYDSTEKFVVCIDPGHQSASDTAPEPVGPGSKTIKPRMTAGVTGVETGVPEYEIALQISMNLKCVLEARGVKVVMTRTTNDVNLSNAERAEIANDAGADIFVRVHGDKSPESSAAGLSTLYPTTNRWTKRITNRSKKAAIFVQSGAIESANAVDRGAIARDDFAGFNWSKVPTVLVQCGFLSNPVEDRLLASPHYQDKLARGMADGIMRYLESNP